MNELTFKINCFLRKRRLIKSNKKLMKSSLKLNKTKEERIWIENNHQIHILNYPFYKIKRYCEHFQNN